MTQAEKRKQYRAELEMKTTLEIALFALHVGVHTGNHRDVAIANLVDHFHPVLKRGDLKRKSA